MTDLLAILPYALLPVAFWGGWYWRGGRYRKASAIRHLHEDEYLYQDKTGAFVPYDPPQFVPMGVHPTIAARRKRQETGIAHSTRRIE